MDECIEDSVDATSDRDLECCEQGESVVINFEIFEETHGMESLEGFAKRLQDFSVKLQNSPKAQLAFKSYSDAAARFDSFEKAFDPNRNPVLMGYSALPSVVFGTTNPDQSVGLANSCRNIEQWMPQLMDVLNGKADCGFKFSLWDIFEDDGKYGFNMMGKGWQSIRSLRDVTYSKAIFDRMIELMGEGRTVATIREICNISKRTALAEASLPVEQSIESVLSISN